MHDYLGPYWEGVERAVDEFLIDRHYCLGPRPPGRWPAHALPHNFYELLIISIKSVVITNRRNAGIGNLLNMSFVRVKISNDLRHGAYVTDSNDKASLAMRDFSLEPLTSVTIGTHPCPMLSSIEIDIPSNSEKSMLMSELAHKSVILS
jgi:hypothetical protein